MEATKQQLAQIRLLSDHELYRKAQDFLEQNPPPEAKQMAGLLEFARDFGELQAFVAHQKERDWGTGPKAHYKTFYEKLEGYLRQLRQQTKTSFGLIPDGLGKKEEAAQMDFWAGLLAREFVQHLAAQAMQVQIQEAHHARL